MGSPTSEGGAETGEDENLHNLVGDDPVAVIGDDGQYCQLE